MSVVSRDPTVPITAEQWAELERRWPDVALLEAAFMLAPDIVTCADLLAGVHVDRERLDDDGLVWADERRLVRLRPLDIVNVVAPRRGSW